MNDTRITADMKLAVGCMTMTKGDSTKNVSNTSFTDLMNHQVPQMVDKKSEPMSETARNRISNMSDYTQKDTSDRIAQVQTISKLPKERQEEICDQIEEVSARIKETIKEVLDISEEDLNLAMEQLGIMNMDLLDPQDLTQLVSALTQTTDASGLLLNGDLLQIMGKAQEVTQELLQDLGVSMEELQEFCQQYQSDEMPAMDLTDLRNETDQSEEVSRPQRKVAEQSVPVAEQTKVESNVQNETTEPVDVEDAIARQSTQEDGQEQEESLLQQEESGQVKENETESGSAQRTQPKEEFQVGQEKEPVHTQPQIQQNVQADGSIVETRTTVQYVDSKQIIQQIVQHATTHITSEQTTLSMQLNPENLGKIYLQVAYKQGTLTAQLAAQNEVVKEAIESQVTQLRENLNQQGIKVEAIEVTIASHEFEQNLEKGQQQKQQQEEQRRRKLDVDEADIQGLFEELPEEESVQERIMQEQGNSLNLRA